MAENQTEIPLQKHAAAEQVIKAAADAVLKDRRKEYGLPKDNFQNIARLWQVYKGPEFTRSDVAIMCVLIKIGRLMDNPTHFDSWTDIAGYAACGAEVAAADKREQRG